MCRRPPSQKVRQRIAGLFANGIDTEVKVSTVIIRLWSVSFKRRWKSRERTDWALIRMRGVYPTKSIAAMATSVG